MTVKLRASGWELNGEYLPWVWGQINYWDIDRTHWHDVLKTYKASGHQVLSTAVLPSVHQHADHYDFGKNKSQLDLGAFLAEVKEVGLKIVLWVGPRCVPGVAAAGYPSELLLDEEALARDVHGRIVLSSVGSGHEIFSLPTLVSDRLTQALKPFADALQGILPAWIHPDGPVIGIGMTQAPGWESALSVFSADFSQAAVAFYHSFLKKHYSKISQLNKAYGTQFSSFQAIHPPQAVETQELNPDSRFLDWAQCREEYFVAAAERLHALFGSLSLDRIPIFLATLPTAMKPSNLIELEKSRCFTYAGPDQACYGSLPAALSLVGQTRFLIGFQAEISTLAAADNYQQMKNIALGVRGWDALAPAGAGEYQGFISDRLGAPIRPRSNLWETLQQHASSENFLASQLFGEVLLLSLPDMERMNYLLQQPPLRMDLLQREIPENPAVVSSNSIFNDYFQGLKQTEQLLLNLQFPFLKVSADCPAERLQKAKVLILPGMANLSEEIQAIMLQCVSKTVDLIILGPMPVHPEEAKFASLQELASVKTKKTTRVAKGEGKNKTVRMGRVLHLPEFSEHKLLRCLLQLGVHRPLTIDDTRVQLTFHRFRNRIFIAAMNQAAEAIETLVRREGKFVLKDFWNENKFWGGNNEIKIKLESRQIKFWELIPC